MSGNEPRELENAEPESRRGRPPDGYLGYRSEEPAEGTRVGCVGWIIITVATVAIIYVLLWLLGRELKSHGI
jgi:hypothetical protein